MLNELSLDDNKEILSISKNKKDIYNKVGFSKNSCLFFVVIFLIWIIIVLLKVLLLNNQIDSFSNYNISIKNLYLSLTLEQIFTNQVILKFTLNKALDNIIKNNFHNKTLQEIIENKSNNDLVEKYFNLLNAEYFEKSDNSDYNISVEKYKSIFSNFTYSLFDETIKDYTKLISVYDIKKSHYSNFYINIINENICSKFINNNDNDFIYRFDKYKENNINSNKIFIVKYLVFLNICIDEISSSSNYNYLIELYKDNLNIFNNFNDKKNNKVSSNNLLVYFNYNKNILNNIYKSFENLSENHIKDNILSDFISIQSSIINTIMYMSSISQANYEFNNQYFRNFNIIYSISLSFSIVFLIVVFFRAFNYFYQLKKLFKSLFYYNNCFYNLVDIAKNDLELN